VKYALLIYGAVGHLEAMSDEERRRIDADVAELLAKPSVSGWVRLQGVESATTVRKEDGRTLLTDGPFVDSKEFLGGLIVVEAANLDQALAIAEDFQAVRSAGAIEVRPIRDSE
jgi:hypothetical protein